MQSIRLTAAAAMLVCAGGLAFAQGVPSTTATTPADPVQAKATDEKYVAACTTKVAKELCGCVVQVANIHVNDVAERQVFYDYMMGEVDKAKAQRAMFTPEKARTFNVALQKADTMLGEQCEKFKEKPKDAKVAPGGAPAKTQ